MRLAFVLSALFLLAGYVAGTGAVQYVQGLVTSMGIGG